MRSPWLGVAIAFGLVLAGCSSTADSGDVAAAADSDSTAAQDTSAEPEPEPTAQPEPEPTAEPEPTVEAEPTPIAECAAPVGVSELTLTVDSVDYLTRFFVPESAAGSTEPLATVLNWHGHGSNGNEQATYSAYESLAKTEGFVVVHPTGLPDSGGSNSWELVDDQDPDRDDLAFADALIDEVVANWCGDVSRIYSTGMSNGGYFTARLVCERGDRIAAAVSVAATYHLPECSPARPVPYVAFHGTADAVVPFDGNGESSLNGDLDAGDLFSLVIPDEFAEFAVDAACDADPDVAELSEEVIQYNYVGCTDDIPLTFYEIVGGGHQWPGSPLGPALEGQLGASTDDIGATAEGWAFLSQHTL